MRRLSAYRVTGDTIIIARLTKLTYQHSKFSIKQSNQQQLSSFINIMSSNKFTDSGSSGDRPGPDNWDPRYRWSTYYEGPPLDLSQPGYEYVAHPVVMDGPSPAPPSPIPPKRKSVRKIVRQLSNKIMGRKTRGKGDRKKTLFDADTLFVPSRDRQLVFDQSPSGTSGANPNQKEHFNWKESVMYCRTCQLSYLIGKAGAVHAGLHPHHLGTLNNQRSLVAIVDAFPSVDDHGQTMAYPDYWFGPRSKYNVSVKVGPFANSDDALAFSLRDSLLYMIREVLPKRKDMLTRHERAPRNLLLQGDSENCRIIIFTKVKDAPPIDDTSSDDLKELDDTLKYIAGLGIEVVWGDVNTIT